MGQKYFIDFENRTGKTWTLGVFMTLPDSVGLESVAWLQTTAPDGGDTGVDWTIDYQAMLADYKQEAGRGVYKASQRKDTLLGKKWKVIYQEGVQQLVEDGKAERDDTILIYNDSNETASPGMGMSGEGSVFKREILSGTAAQFVVKPTYYIGLFNDLVRGEVISSNVTVGPEKLQFPEGFNVATITASVKDKKLVLDIQYGRRASVLVADLERQLQARRGQSLFIEGDRATTNTLAPNKTHKWDKGAYKSLSFKWAGPAGEGTCSVKIGEKAESLLPPKDGIDLNEQGGSLTNNTTKTIQYTLK